MFSLWYLDKAASNWLVFRCCLIKLTNLRPCPHILIFSKKETFFSVCTSCPHVHSIFGHKYGGFWKRSQDRRFLKMEIYRIHLVADFFKYGEKNLRFRKYPDTCGRGFRISGIKPDINNRSSACVHSLIYRCTRAKAFVCCFQLTWVIFNNRLYHSFRRHLDG